MLKTVLCCFFSLAVYAAFAQVLDKQVEDLLAQMSTEEKIHQLINNTFFTTGDNVRLGIPGFQMSDGPHGVRFGGATSFPTGIAMAATWDPDLNRRVGKAMGEEFWAYGKHQQLGPCLDLTRDPRNGRSPESSGEDPYLSGVMGAAVIQGIQQTPVIATVKHFNLVNRQQYRHNSNITISERWLMEHYGQNFRMAIQEGGAFSLMNAYNLVNGTYCSANAHLLKTILRDRWGFPFYVVSDWGAVHHSKSALQDGTDICMGSGHYEDDLQLLLNTGQISQADLDFAVRNVLRTKAAAGMLDFYPRPPAGLINSEEHQLLALEAARKTMVLLKNKDQILPIDPSSVPAIALVGPSANKAQLDGFGSSWVEPIYTVSPRQGIAGIIGNENIRYAPGCDINSSDTSRFAAARAAAQAADYVIFVGGLDDTQEGEGYGDRPEYDRAGGSVQLPGKQQELINELAKVNDNIIVVIKSGGICSMEECIDNIKGFIYAFYPGQEGGNAIADVLFGLYNPGGKLPVTMPKGDGQLPPWNDNFNDDFGCGYRWYDQFQLEPRYVFGHGLSYTEFSYANIQVNAQAFQNGQPLRIFIELSNKGALTGEEVVQLYISDEESSIWMPEKQLKGFERVELQPGETRTITFELTAEDFCFWDENSNTYQVEPGTFTARVGGSSGNLPLQVSFEITEDVVKPDLEISKIFTIPRFPVEGDSVSLFAYLRNAGAEEFAPGNQVGINFRAGNQEIGTARYEQLSIPAGGMYMVELEDAYWVPDADGEFEITAIADPGNLVDEVVETNNLYVQQVTVLDSLVLVLNNNLALHKPASGSSSESSELTPGFAVDGNPGTRWSSLFYDPQEFVVDLEGLYDLIQVRIQWETAYSSTFRIEISRDGTDWTEVVYEQDGDGHIDEFAVEGTARYVRFTGLKRATEWGHSFYEFEVYGSSHESVVSSKEKYPKELNLIRIVPNPVNDRMYISGLPDDLSMKGNMFNEQGQCVLSESLANGMQIHMERFAPDVYFLHLEYQGAVRVLRVVKI